MIRNNTTQVTGLAWGGLIGRDARHPLLQRYLAAITSSAKTALRRRQALSAGKRSVSVSDLFFCLSIALIASWLPTNASACPAAVSGIITVSGSVSSRCDLDTGESITVSSGADVTTTGEDAVKIRQKTGGSIFNAGSLLTDGKAIFLDYDSGLLGNVDNSGLVQSTGGFAVHMFDSDVKGAFYNRAGGLITSSSHAMLLEWNSKFEGGLWNAGTIQTTGQENAIQIEDSSTIGGIFNLYTGRITGPESAINIVTACHELPNWAGCNIYSPVIPSITNFGEISATNSSTPDIYVADDARIGEINNYQGTSGSFGRALTYQGRLPNTYNVVIYDDAYGQFAIDPTYHSGQMTFGVYAGSSENDFAGSSLQRRTYTDVLTGLSAEDIANEFAQSTPGDHRAFGLYGDSIWMLRESVAGFSWDLDILDPGLESLSRVTSGRLAALSRALDHECSAFGPQNACLEGGIRMSSMAGTGANGLWASYAQKLDDRIHVTGFADLSVGGSSVGSVTGNGGITLGASASYAENDNYTGFFARVAAIVDRSSVDLSHRNYVGTATFAEGTADMDSYALSARLGWGANVQTGSVLQGYVEGRFNYVRRQGYSDVLETGVDEGMTFDPYTYRSATVLAGAELTSAIGPSTRFRFGAEVELGLLRSSDLLRATSSIAGLEDISFASPGISSGTNIRLSGGVEHDLDPRRTLSVKGVAESLGQNGIVGLSIFAAYRVAL